MRSEHWPEWNEQAEFWGKDQESLAVKGPGPFFLILSGSNNVLGCCSWLFIAITVKLQWFLVENVSFIIAAKELQNVKYKIKQKSIGSVSKWFKIHIAWVNLFR